MNHACTRVTKMSRSALMQVTKEVEAFNKHTDCQLKEYQLIGVLWLLTLQQEQQNGILADDMGLVSF
jgi:SNF2 family DNA or RNA helicase